MRTPVQRMCFNGTLHYVTQDGTEDEYGDPAERETTVNTKFLLQQTASAENSSTDNVQIVEADLFLPPATSPDGLARLTGLNRVWELVGTPNPITNRWGVRTHWEAKVQAS